MTKCRPLLKRANDLSEFYLKGFDFIRIIYHRLAFNCLNINAVQNKNVPHKKILITKQAVLKVYVL